MHLISFEFTALALIVVTLALHARMTALAPFAMQVATVVGLLRTALLLASVMVYNHGMSVAVDLYPESPGRAAALWQPLETVAEALGGTGGELLGGIWFLLLNSVALRFAALPRVLAWVGTAIGAAGILSVVPALSALEAVFGLLQIVWFLCLGVILLRAARPASATEDLSACLCVCTTPQRHGLSQAGLADEATGADRIDQGLVVALVLVGVGGGEVGDRPVEGVAGAEVGGDRDPVPGAGVGAGEGRIRRSARRGSALGGHVARRRRSPSSRAAGAGRSRGPGRPRPVTRCQPRKMSLAACIRRWPATTRWPRLRYRLLPTNRSRTDAWASLACRNSGSCLVSARAAAGSRPGCRRCRPRRPCGPCRRTRSARAGAAGRSAGCGGTT